MDIPLSPRSSSGSQRWWHRFARWWLERTSSKGWQYPVDSWLQREHQRRSELTSWLLLILMLCDLLAFLTGISDVHSLISVSAIGIVLLIAVGLNRAGHVTLVGWLLSVTLILAFFFSITPEGETSPPGALDMDALPVYDLLSIPLVVAMTLLKPSAVFWLALLTSLGIFADFVLQHHTPALTAQMQVYGGGIIGTAVFVVRPIILLISMLSLAMMWVRGTLRARVEALRAQQQAELRRRLTEQQEQQLQAARAFATQVEDALQSGTEIALPTNHPFAEIAELLNSHFLRQGGEH